MAISVGVGPTNNRVEGGTTTCAVTLAGCTAGRSVVIMLGWNGVATTLSSLACPGETVSLIESPLVYTNGSCVMQLAIIEGLAGSGDKTITLTLSGSSVSVVVGAIELYGASTVVYEGNEASATGTASHTTTLTTATANAAIVGICGSNENEPDGLPGTTPLAYTAIPLLNPNVPFGGEYYLDVGAAGAKTVNWAISGSNWGIKAAAFIEEGAAPSFIPRRSLLGVG